MINTYLIPVCTDDDLYIESVKSINFNNAKEKLIKKWQQQFNVDEDDWDKLLDKLSENNIFVGDISLIDEF